MVLPAEVTDPSYAVEFWDVTNREDWAACESVQRGAESPHFRPGPLAPAEDTVYQWVTMIARGYLGKPLSNWNTHPERHSRCPGRRSTRKDYSSAPADRGSTFCSRPVIRSLTEMDEMGVGMDPGRDHEFAEFVDGRFTALQRFGYLLTGEWHLAEDLVQTSLTKVWFHRNSLRSGNALESYTRTVMVNTSTQWWRRKWRGETPSNCLSRTPGSSTAPWTTATCCCGHSPHSPAGPARRWSCGTSKICRRPRSPRS